MHSVERVNHKNALSRIYSFAHLCVVRYGGFRDSRDEPAPTGIPLDQQVRKHMQTVGKTLAQTSSRISIDAENFWPSLDQEQCDRDLFARCMEMVARHQLVLVDATLGRK